MIAGCFFLRLGKNSSSYLNSTYRYKLECGKNVWFSFIFTNFLRLQQNGNVLIQLWPPNSGSGGKTLRITYIYYLLKSMYNFFSLCGRDFLIYLCWNGCNIGFRFWIWKYINYYFDFFTIEAGRYVVSNIWSKIRCIYDTN